ncbi:MAG: STAS domain-containing protein [Planctomycetes bacterium]|nr:STAS domain-containing protein [Planctomycetota bacterium]
MSTTANLLVQSIKDVTVVQFQESSILDALMIQEISEELNHLVETQHQQKLLLDFMKVKFLSSSALGILVTLRKKVDANKGDLVICGMNPELRKVFKITNLEKLFKFADDEPSAMALLGATTAG